MGFPHYVCSTDENVFQGCGDRRISPTAIWGGPTPRCPGISLQRTGQVQGSAGNKQRFWDADCIWPRATTSKRKMGPRGRAFSFCGLMPTGIKVLFCSFHHRPNSRLFCAFPMGTFPPRTTHGAACRENGLSVADKPDSQDICYCPKWRLRRSVIRKLRRSAQSRCDIVDTEGNVLRPA